MLPANLSDIIPNASLEAIDLIMVSIDVDMTSWCFHYQLFLVNPELNSRFAAF